MLFLETPTMSVENVSDAFSLKTDNLIFLIIQLVFLFLSFRFDLSLVYIYIFVTEGQNIII